VRMEGSQWNMALISRSVDIEIKFYKRTPLRNTS
jgi:hypothetical protein